jgi:hypothetical protein
MLCLLSRRVDGERFREAVGQNGSGIVALDRAGLKVEYLEVERVLALGSDGDVLEDEPDAGRAVYVGETSCGHEEI